MKRLSLLLLFMLAARAEAGCPAAGDPVNVADTCTITSPPTRAKIEAAVNAADDFGDTISIPEGTITDWETPFVVLKNVSFIGATTVNSATGTFVDRTIIQDNVKQPSDSALCWVAPLNPDLNCSPNTPVFDIRTKYDAGGRTVRISGLTFTSGKHLRVGNFASITIGGLSRKVRIDHNHFLPAPQSRFVQVNNAAIWGVADHNVMQSNGQQSFNIRMGNWPYTDDATGTSSAANGDGSWESPTNFGDGSGAGGTGLAGASFYIEDNWLASFNLASTEEGLGNLDATVGGRFVFRFNHCWQSGVVLSHGTFGSRFRGTRSVEIYNNDFHRNEPNVFGATESGTSILFDNTYAGPAPNGNNGFLFQNYRLNGSSGPWGTASGFSPYDLNDERTGSFTGQNARLTGSFPYAPTAGPSPVEGGLYYSGSVVTASPTPPTNSSQVLTISPTPSPAWSPSHWDGFNLSKTTGVTSGPPRAGGQISNATANGFTVTNYSKNQPDPLWGPGIAFRIGRVLVGIDQPGRGQGDRLCCAPSAFNEDAGSAGILSPPSSAWPHQKLEPIYGWNNRQGSTQLTVAGAGTDTGFAVENRDYYNEETPNGSGAQTVGIRRGTNAPTHNCTAPASAGTYANGSAIPSYGMGYWATSAPSSNWNTTTPGDDGALYVCTATNTWSRYYTPYTYPHPLVDNIVTPGIKAPNSATFTLGVAGTHTFDYEFFTAAPSWTITSGTLPTGVTLAAGTSGVLSGTPTQSGDFGVVVTATYAPASEVATQSFTLHVNDTNTAPDVPVITAPAESSAWLTNQTITITATAADPDGTIANVKFFVDGNVTALATDTTLPYSTTWNTSSSIPLTAGTHTIVATATDDKSASTSSATRTISVTAPPVTPAVPANIRIGNTPP